MPCLNCGATLSAASSVRHSENPHKNAITICSECGHIMILDDHLNFRELSDEEVVEIAGNKEVLEIQKKMGELREQKAARVEVDKILTDKIHKMHPVVAHILNAPFEGIRFCATDESLPGIAGYGENPQTAIRAMFNNLMERTLDEVIRNKKRR